MSNRRNTVLLTLGRLPVSLDLARSFRRAGWRVVVADPFGMHLLRMSRAVARSYRVPAARDEPLPYLTELREIVRREDVRLVVPVSEESMHVSALHGSLPTECALFCAPQEKMLTLHDKLLFNRRAGGLGLRVPPSAEPGTREAADIAANGDFVVKPRHSCSGRGVTLHRRGDPVPQTPGTVVQAFLPGRQFSSFAVVHEGRVLANVIYRGVVMSGSVAVCFERAPDLPAIESWVRRFSEGIAHSGFLAFDFIVDRDGDAAAIECNPRATSGIHFLEPAELAAAVLGRGEAGVRTDGPLTESWSCYTACLDALPDTNLFLERFRRLRAARDITWSREDPWPFLAMPINTWPLIWRAIRRRQTFAEVAALDIEWADAAVA